VDISRITWTLAREERLGSVRTTGSPGRAKPEYELTATGERRQRTWMLRVPDDVTPDDILVRALLAIQVADRATFETIVAVCLAHVELNRLGDADLRREGALTPKTARAELADAALAAQLGWLQTLRTRPRERDAAAPT
jgi:hypothetical protein